MSRSKWKGYYQDSFLTKRSHLRIWSRGSSIPAHLLNQYVLIHNGKTFQRVLITENKIGFKFGEFSYTRRDKKRLKYKK